MGMKDKTKTIAAKFRLDSHHAIERFGVFFAVIAGCFVLVFASASTSSIANQQEQMDTTTVYTPAMTTSKTQLSVEVPTIYVNKAKTRAMVLMRFDDAGSISANAKKYQGFLTGSNKDLAAQALKTNITGQIVVFGSTGYMAEILDSDRPFEQQIVNLTMRANSELVYKSADSRKVRSDLEGQKTFSQFDQWRVYFNPGAKGTTVTKALDGDTFDASAVYNQIIVSPEEKAARTTMEDALGQMRVDLARIAEYESDLRRVKVDGVSLVQPTVPAQIAGDEVTGEPGASGEASSLQLKPKWVSPAGYDFDWRSGTVAKGYLDALVPKEDSYVTWLADKHEASKDEDQSTVTIPDDQWKLSNGRLLSDYDSGDTAMEPLFDIRNNLAQAYQDYYKDKLAYQVDDYEALIDLEVQLRNVQTTASMNDTAKALFTY